MYRIDNEVGDDGCGRRMPHGMLAFQPAKEKAHEQGDKPHDDKKAEFYRQYGVDVGFVSKPLIDDIYQKPAAYRCSHYGTKEIHRKIALKRVGRGAALAEDRGNHEMVIDGDGNGNEYPGDQDDPYLGPLDSVFCIDTHRAGFLHNKVQIEWLIPYRVVCRLLAPASRINYLCPDITLIHAMLQRPRRNRKSAAVRAMVQENQVQVPDLMYPLFLLDGKNQKVEVSSMPGIYRLSIDLMLREVEECMKLGIVSFDIFPVVEEQHKDKMATMSYADNFYLRALKEVKKEFPEACIMTDVAMDPYSSDGHDGIVENGKILNDETLQVLGKMAVAQAETGIDIIGPSDMMDGRVGFIRQMLDTHGFQETSIMSYTAKYASAFYGPFRDALDSAPKFGDKKTYQMDPANSREALLEADLDADEGADFLMVKPALAYLDIISLLRNNHTLPIAAYNVSGEYAMVAAAAEKGWIDYDRVMDETLLSMKRAGADVILTYFARQFAERQQAMK